MESPRPAYRGEGSYVFVCYAHEDADAVFRQIAWLNDYGVNAWYDEGITPGQEWREELAAAIQGATRVLFFVTPRSVVSEHCKRELNFAQEENREVVVIHLEPTELPAGLRLGLNNRQAIFKRELSDDDYHQRMLRATHAEVQPISQAVARSRVRLGPALGVIILVAVAGGIWWLSSPDSPPVVSDSGVQVEPAELESPEVLHNSIAVLPFDNLSQDPQDAYFAAGIHEEILNQLAKVRDLSVIARTTMLRYVDSSKPIPEIGAELNVRTVMEGSVRYAGNRVRITAQLIDAASGAHLWSQAYEEDLEDIFGIQLAVATEIARTLEAEFSPGEQGRVAMPTTDDPAAYAHYLRAISGWGNFAPTEPMHEAIDAALALDPQFAAAMAFKALLHAMEANFGPPFVGPDFDENDQRRLAGLARAYAHRALKIDDTQAQAHWALASVHTLNREWEAGQQRIARAYALNPNDYIILNGAAWDSLGRGDIDTGVQLMQRSVALNPGDFANQASAVGFLYMCERWEEAKRQATLLTTLAPNDPLGYVWLAQIASHVGDVESVHANASLAEARSNGPPYLTLAITFNRIGDQANARRVYDTVYAFFEPNYLNSWSEFWMHLAVNEHDVALDHLESALAQGTEWVPARDLHFLSHHPMFDPVREYPRFAELVQRAGLPLDRSP